MTSVYKDVYEGIEEDENRLSPILNRPVSLTVPLLQVQLHLQGYVHTLAYLNDHVLAKGLNIALGIVLPIRVMRHALTTTLVRLVLPQQTLRPCSLCPDMSLNTPWTHG